MSAQDAVNSWLKFHTCAICSAGRQCPETEAMLADVPAVEHVRAAGAAQLPGFNDVPTKLAERTDSWRA